MCRIRKNLRALIATAGISVIGFSAQAIGIEPNASIGLQYTDNAKKVASSAENDLIVIATVGSSINAGSGPFQLDADASLKYLDYTQDSFDNRQYFNLKAIAGWEMLKDRIDWKLQDFFTQQLINSTSPVAPNNIQDTNVLTFGPNIYYRLSGRQLVTLKPELRQFSYQSQNIDNQQKALDVAWKYQLFRSVNVGVRGGVNNTDYDDALLTDNTFRNIHLTLFAARPGYLYSMDLGSTSVDRAGGGSDNGLTGKINWTFDVTSSSKLQASFASEITDSSSRLLTASLDPDAGDLAGELAPEQSSSDILRNRVFRVAYKNGHATVRANLWLEIRQQDYEFALLDQDVHKLGVELNYPLTAILSAGLNTSYAKVALLDLGRTDDEFNIAAKLDYRWNRRLRGVIDIKYENKESTLSTARFHAISLFASLSYDYAI